MKKFAFTLFLFPICLMAKVDVPVHERFSSLIAANEEENWKQLIVQSEEFLKVYSESTFAQEAVFYLGIAHFKQGDYDWANHYFSDYLKQQAAPKHFEEAIQHKFEIAQKFKSGSKKHLFGAKMLPQWMPAKEEAIAIFDEVIAALPHHELAANSLFSKGQLLCADEDFLGSLDAYQTLIRRFPKHPLAAESYIAIGEVYLTQSEVEYPDPDFLDLAEINLRKFRTNFPREEKISVAENVFGKMQEHYAQNLLETGRFFERTKKYSAAIIYYTKILASFPNSRAALQCKERMDVAKVKLDKQEKK